MWRRIASAAMVLGMTVAARPASAAAITFELNTLVAGSPVQGDQVATTLTFEDIAAGTVRLTVASSLNDPGEFISEIAFNVQGFVPGAITVSNSTLISGTFALPTLNASAQNAQNPAGTSSGFDFNFEAESGNSDGGANRFNLSDSFRIDLSATGLDATDFLALNVDGYYALNHVQGIGPSRVSSNFAATPSDEITPVPEPASLLLLGAGLALAARRARQN